MIKNNNNDVDNDNGIVNIQEYVPEYTVFEKNLIKIKRAMHKYWLFEFGVIIGISIGFIFWG